jgi:hypothetical protein
MGHFPDNTLVIWDFKAFSSPSKLEISLFTLLIVICNILKDPSFCVILTSKFVKLVLFVSISKFKPS